MKIESEKKIGSVWEEKGGEREREIGRKHDPKCEEEEMRRWDLVTTGSLVPSIFDLNVLWHFSSPLLRCN